MKNVAIIGSGPAGYTAGIYAGRANLEPVLFEGLESGGQLMLTTDVENYPGFVDGIMGPELMQVFKGQAERFGTEIKTEIIDSIENIDGGFKLTSSKGEYEFKSVIIASGASARWLGVEGEKELQRSGVKKQSYIKQISRERAEGVEVLEVQSNKGVKIDIDGLCSFC